MLFLINSEYDAIAFKHEVSDVFIIKIPGFTKSMRVCRDSFNLIKKVLFEFCSTQWAVQSNKGYLNFKSPDKTFFKADYHCW
jgi:hypothetical protein